MGAAAIIVAAGQGRRAGGGLAKQFRRLGSKPVFAWSLDAFARHRAITQIVLVVPHDGAEVVAGVNRDANVTIVTGGATRSDSVRAGLSACRVGDNDPVLIHDAARPGLSGMMITRLLCALADGAAAAAPALAIADAIRRRVPAGLDSVDRDGLYRVQTPQAFHFGAIRRALAGGGDFIDDLDAVKAGGDGRAIALVPGDERLSKITVGEDFDRMALLLNQPPPPRFGTGFDVHAFAPGDHVMLCGVRIPHTYALAGHSDADVAWHALTDAIFGAAALGDIGLHFPPSDPQWRKADSGLFLTHALKCARRAGLSLASCDVTIVCEAPKIGPHRDAMRLHTAELTGLDHAQVSVKATTTEGLGFTGRREGIAAQASAVLVARHDRDG